MREKLTPVRSRKLTNADIQHQIEIRERRIPKLNRKIKSEEYELDMLEDDLRRLRKMLEEGQADGLG